MIKKTSFHHPFFLPFIYIKYELGTPKANQLVYIHCAFCIMAVYVQGIPKIIINFQSH